MNMDVTNPPSVLVEEEDNEICNNTGNRPFNEVLQVNMERRDVLRGGLAMGATAFFGGSLISPAAEAQTGASLMSFTPVSLAEGNGPMPAISPDYEYQVLIPWGEPLEPSGPAYSYPPSAADQALQIGIGHDGCSYFALDNIAEQGAYEERVSAFLSRFRQFQDANIGATSEHGIFCINHEFGRNSVVLGGKDAPESLSDVRVSQHAHGVSVVEIQRTDGAWHTVEGNYNRRIHVNTPVQFSGPAAGSELLATPNGNIALGTVNNCGNGTTPWGTYITCEENFNGYFGATNTETTWVATEERARYGFSESGFGYGWHLFDRRFDLSNPDYQNEENRFGWMVEIDPMDPNKPPVKRTALGRFKHEGAAFNTAADGRIAVYMGDDQRFDYIYKFVSDGAWEDAIAAGESPLDAGTLYAARFNDDGTGDWLELSLNNPAVAAQYSTEAEIMVYARLAADLAGATPMDRPEWTTTAPDGTVYVTLTNNSRREVADAANPMAPNADGHIIRFLEADAADTSFAWEIFLIAEDTHGTEASFADPDGIWADPDGRIFIETDGGQKDGLNNQLLIADAQTKEIRRLFTGVTGDEITGIALTPDRRTLFINTQHPGNGDPSQTNFPANPDGVTIPRDSTIVITRKNGGIIGS